METERVINVVGFDCNPEVEEKFNAWYSERHVPVVFKNEGMRRVARYKRIGNGEQYPKYLTIYEFKGFQAFKEYDSGPELAAAFEELQDTWPEAPSEVKWRVQYELIKTWEK